MVLTKSFIVSVLQVKIQELDYPSLHCCHTVPWSSTGVEFVRVGPNRKFVPVAGLVLAFLHDNAPFSSRHCCGHCSSFL